MATYRGTLKNYKGGYTGNELLNQYNNQVVERIKKEAKAKKETKNKPVSDPTPLQSYPTSSGSGSGGSSGSGGGYYINSMLEALKAGNQAAYDAQVQAARTANEQSLKNLSDAYNRYREDYTTNKAN